MEETEPFNTQMRKATRDIHALSDALVNAKLAFVLSDTSVWAEGLLVFYEIFRYLEEAMQRLKHKPVGRMYIEGMQRTEAFEKDLAYYLGNDWAQNYCPRESVANYLLHLIELEEKDPDLLIAYIYHLYMGLLSGGQILRKKWRLTMKIPFIRSGKTNYIPEGEAVLNFNEHKIFSLKKEMREALNSTVALLDEDTRHRILKESVVVFELNNTLVRSVNGVNSALVRKVSYFLLALVFHYILYKIAIYLYSFFNF